MSLDKFYLEFTVESPALVTPPAAWQLASTSPGEDHQRQGTSRPELSRTWPDQQGHLPLRLGQRAQPRPPRRWTTSRRVQPTREKPARRSCKKLISFEIVADNAKAVPLPGLPAAAARQGATPRSSTGQLLKCGACMSLQVRRHYQE